VGVTNQHALAAQSDAVVVGTVVQGLQTGREGWNLRQQSKTKMAVFFSSVVEYREGLDAQRSPTLTKVYQRFSQSCTLRRRPQFLAFTSAQPLRCEGFTRRNACIS
jgi:hypothetical protein